MSLTSQSNNFFKKNKNRSHKDYKFISILLWVLININNTKKHRTSSDPMDKLNDLSFNFVFLNIYIYVCVCGGVVQKVLNLSLKEEV